MEGKKRGGGISRKAIRILVLSMYAVVIVTTLRILFTSKFFLDTVSILSIQTTVGELVGGTLIFFCLLSLLIRLLEGE
jgi:hypothetical protein